MATRVIAFDVYETLVRWPATAVRALDVQRLLERYGIFVSYQAYEAARQCTLFIDAARRPVHGYVDFLALTFARLEAKVPLDLIESLAGMYESRGHMEILPDALAALEAARGAGMTTCAFTTLPRFMLGRAADELLPRLDHYFDISAIRVQKGDKRYYEEVTRRLGVAPGEIVCVGDDPVCDCELPAEAGWRPVLLDRAGRYAGEVRWPRIAGLEELARVW